MVKPQHNTPNTVNKHPTLGFGVPATSDPHHFKVIIPKANSGKVQINEYLGLQAQSQESAVIERVVLDRTRWTEIRAEVQRAFNARLKSYNLKTSAWQVGENVVDRLLGKELCVLAWAVEDMDVGNISLAVRNWLALRPEERWWLFAMTAKSTGTVEDRDVGWRIALRHALGDIVQSEQQELSQPSSSVYIKHQSKKSEIQTPSADYGAETPVSDEIVLPQEPDTEESLLTCEASQPEHIEAQSDNEATVSIEADGALFLFEAKLAKAVGLPIGNNHSPEFLVKKGSTANIALAKSLRPAIRDLRQQLLEDDVLIIDGEVYSFTKDYLFKSPSAAACVIAGNPRSGMDAWRDFHGRSLKELGYGKKS
ncbi:DUF3780 and DUF4357 domain-containing protein [Alkalimonas sp. MEB108]|uniref:DUF3780 and DUF4357 domain-containing protein n=1 Tax=Alkalimonas cellulosilytica TaxID=3058395 RepID=A0ABU7J9V7_9GAMM|nr:anti-phage-associated DUF3780 domain-containing protein [Alkalimonas sp. MEB108]MEE2003048.1 DUF3780 and DUF4357 domain-containing protein [Alkalimonas sp. MEB108]